MFRKLGDGSNIAVGDDFTKHLPDLDMFREGVVTHVDDHTVSVDFGDFKIVWDRDDVALYAQTSGFYREFYSSPQPGDLTMAYRSRVSDQR